ncbi:MAG: DUF3108 domain-containing protein [Gemmatimonadetes bacterium]|nr:DUF3108 domain-containing protein [Gemmatimonadota bacterium]
MTRRALCLFPLLGGLALAPGGAAGAGGAESGPSRSQDGPRTCLAAVPFGVGERLTYDVKFGPFGVGAAEMRVVGIDTLDGSPTYHVRFTIRGGLPFYRVDDEQESWIDVRGLFSRKFRQSLRQGDYIRNREYVFDVQRGLSLRNDGRMDTIPPEPLDDASFLYFLRALPLEVGARYEFHRYYRSDRNPVILEVLRRETVDVPAGRFETVVVRPIVKAGGVYGEGGESEVFVSDDADRIVVLTRSKAMVGSLSLHLKARRRGAPLSTLPGFQGSGC